MDEAFDILNSFDYESDSNAGSGSRSGGASASTHQVNSNDSMMSDNDSTVGSRVGEQIFLPCRRKRGGFNPMGKSGDDDKVQPKACGKFRQRIEVRMRKVAKGGSFRSVTGGQDMIHVPMNDERKSIVLDLMAKNNNFGEEADMDNPQTMMDHLKCLLIMNEAYTNNGQGKADRYPRYLSVLIGQGKCFQSHTQIKSANRVSAMEYMTSYIRSEKIHTQNIKVSGNKVPAMQAPEKKREALIEKLVKDHMHGFDSYVQLMQDQKDGKLKLLDPPIFKTPATAGEDSGASALSAANTHTNHQHIGNPDSPFAPVHDDDE